jgi:hypothetical protein
MSHVAKRSHSSAYSHKPSAYIMKNSVTAATDGWLFTSSNCIIKFKIMLRDRVTIDGVWIGVGVIGLLSNTWQHFRKHCHTQTSVASSPRYIYSLGTDRIENTASNISSVAFLPFGANTWRLLSHCLATDVFTEPFPSNFCLCWLQNSDFSRHATIQFIQLVHSEGGWIAVNKRQDMMA